MKVSIVATNGPDTVGGLAAYLRGLTGALSDDLPIPVTVRFNETSEARLSYTRVETPRESRAAATVTRVIAPVPSRRVALRPVRRLMYQRSSQPLAAALFACAFSGPVAAAIPPDAEVVHVIGTAWEMLGPVALRVARRRGAAVTVWPAIHPGTWGDSEFDARFYREVDAVMAQSEFERHRLTELGVAPDRVHVCGLAPNPSPAGDAERFRARYGLGDRPIVLYVGRRQRYKGYHALVEAVAAISHRRADVCLVAAGADVEPPYPPLSDHTLVDLGTCSEEEKADALAACDVFCLPSAGEAFGIGFVEAWSHGKPVIGGPAPAVRELISDGVDGICVDQDPRTIAAAIEGLLGDSRLREELGRAGLRRQQDEFTWRVIARRHRDIFELAIADRST